jgi:Tol biopolymer transport system component
LEFGRDAVTMPAEIAAGTQLGPYTIEAQLGAGGMGVVYRAVDTRLSRKVAIKVSTAAYDARFRREGLAIAALNHPRICTLFDVGPNFLVMELIEGETLAARLGKGALPLPQVLQYGAQIAEALAVAHARGITHRDLKPGNVMLTRSGVKVLDFGLAAMDGAEAALTRTGHIMGTPAYMAPEQRAGHKTDARTDLYALGLVLYEMATGKRLLAPEVEPVTLPDLPDTLAWIVERCLARDPEHRWQSAADVQAVLERAAVRAAAATSSARPGWLWPVLATVGAVVFFGLWLRSRGDVPPAIEEPFHVSISPPPSSSFRFARNGEGGFAISPDGTMLAFIARTGGRAQLWVRRLDGQESLLPETEDAFMPFWSPDSRWIGFLTPGKVKKIEASGGVPEALADFGTNYVGTWGGGANDVILVSRSRFLGSGPLLRLSAAGGALVDVPGTDGGRWPHFLPDGQRFLYVVGTTAPPEDLELWIGSLNPAEKPRAIGRAGQRPTYSSGHVLSVRLGALWAQPFDADRAELSGSAFPLNEPLGSRVFLGGILSDFSANARGMLVYPRRESALTELVWRDRTGKVLGTPGDPGEYYTPRISPDGQRIAFTRRDNQNSDIWTGSTEPATSAFQRFTFDLAIDEHPVWSPDGATLTFSSDATGQANMYRKAVTGAGNAERLTTSPLAEQALQWSSDGKFLLFTQVGRRIQSAAAESRAPFRDGSSEIMVRPAEGGEALSYLGHSGGAVHAQFNPGTPRWIAYDYDDSGRREIYVQAFVPGQQASASRWQVSKEGGTMPRWRADGKELFYLTLEGRMMSVAVSIDGPAFRSANPVVLFDGTPPQMRTVSYEYDVAPDGQRFLLIEPAQKPEFMPLTLVTNWLASAKRK